MNAPPEVEELCDEALVTFSCTKLIACTTLTGSWQS